MRVVIISIVSVFLFLSGCASTGGSGGAMMKEAGAVTKDSVAALIKEAEATNKKAAAAGGLWRDAGKIIKQAKAAATKGDLEKAMKLAQKAKGQGEMGETQAMEQANAKPWLF